jgi:hypothetical protein
MEFSVKLVAFTVKTVKFDCSQAVTFDQVVPIIAVVGWEVKDGTGVEVGKVDGANVGLFLGSGVNTQV